MQHNEDITEALQGQIEALAQSLFVFGAALQHKELVDAQYLQAMLRRRAAVLPTHLYGLAPAQRLMTHLADELQQVFLQAQGHTKLGAQGHPSPQQDTGHQNASPAQEK